MIQKETTISFDGLLNLLNSLTSPDASWNFSLFYSKDWCAHEVRVEVQAPGFRGVHAGRFRVTDLEVVQARYPHGVLMQAFARVAKEVSAITGVSDPVARYRNNTTNEEFLREVGAMPATNTKKKVVRTVKKKIDPKKVKKPLCNVHQTPMEYDPVLAGWACTTSGCSQLAKPIRDADERNVVLGKGGVSLRVMCYDNDTRIVLMSDDNVALDITSMVDVQNFITDNDLRSDARVVRNEALSKGQEPPENLPLLDKKSTVFLDFQGVTIMGGVSEFLAQWD